MTATEKEKHDRPLVTFAVFAYNQEKYIREAIEGAFAQTYEPLEIILSDDCSTDRTFEIMQEMAGGYSGQHTVKVRQSGQNVGTLSHVFSVAREASGDILVVAAGDDISKPNRTEITVYEFEKQEADVLSGSSEIFEDSPDEITYMRSASCAISDHLLSGAPLVQQIHGATAAYKKNFLDGLCMPEEKILLEDYYFRIVAFWLDMRVKTIDEPLVLHRVHERNVGPKARHGSDKKTILDHEREIATHWDRMECLLLHLRDNWGKITDGGTICENSRHVILDDAITYYRMKKRWFGFSTEEKIRFFKLSRKFSNKRSDLLRVLGVNCFIFVYNFRAVLKINM